MALIKLNNRAVKDATAVGTTTQLGNLIFISKQTASSSSSVSFTSGIDSTYKEYIFYFNNIHPATNAVDFTFNMSTDGGSNYNVTKTTTAFHATQSEIGDGAALSYQTDRDLAQGTGYQELARDMGTVNDEGISGYLHLFDPSNTTFVKHFLGTSVSTSDGGGGSYIYTLYVGGYGNTTSAINAVDFKASSGNLDSGEITLFGVA